MSNFKSYFSFSRSEQRGLLVLVVLIVVFLVVPSIFQYFSKPKVWDYSDFAKQVDSLEALLIQQKSVEKKLPKKRELELFTFDPNKVNHADLLRLGFSERQAQVLINYRKAGGVFQKPKDLKKVYGISTELFQSLQPYIQISPAKTKNTTTANRNIPITDSIKPTGLAHKPKLVELNSADTLDLMALKGIGAVLSKRILNYRLALGGFYSVNQLYEVYGLPKETIDKLQDNFRVDSLSIIFISLNNSGFKEINSHPYISYKQTKQLVNYRNLMGSFVSVNDILANHLMDSASFYKVKPYLKLQ